jgi:hypothetical protein
LKIHLTDVRNQDDTVRDSGDATFRLCDNIANVGRDAPEHTRAGNVYDEYIVKGLPVYTSGHKDPQLYMECIVDIFTKASDGVSAGDVRHVCHNINAWENVGPGSTGNAGNPGPAGFANDPQAISARVEVDDGASDVLDWSNLDATITSASNPIVPAATGGCDGFPSFNCMFVAGSTGAAAWYEGMATRVSCSATCPGGLTNGQLYYVHASGQVGSRSFAAPASQYVTLQMVPYGNFTGTSTPAIVNGSQGTGSATFSTRVQFYHTQAWQTLDPTGQDNWAPFGTTTRVTRKVYPAFTLAEKLYWEQTGAIMPLNLAQTPTVDPGPANAESLFYFPDGPGTVIGGGGVGDRPDLGIVNGYAAAAFINEDQTSWDLARLFSFNASVHGIGAVLLNEATGRIPVLNNGPPVGPGGNGIGNSYPVLGVPQPQTNFQNGFVGLLRQPTNLPNPPGLDIGYGPFNYGTALDHMPSFPGFTYIVFGDRYWLDMMRWRGNAGYLQQRTGPGSELGMGYVRDNNAVFPGDGQTYHYYGLMLQCCQERGSAWLRRDITYPATWGSDNDPERAYYADFLKETDNYEPLYEAWVDGPGSTAYRSSMSVPDNQGLGVAPQLFIATYGFDSEWLGLVWQHQPMASRWLTRYQRFLEGCMGGLPNAPVSYYCLSYTMTPAIHLANYEGGSDNGGNLGPGTNGVDAADYGALAEASSYSIGPGGQITEIPLNMTPPAQIKNIWGWFDEGGTRAGRQIDQLGQGWYSVIGPTTFDAANFIATFYIQCSSADHVAFPAQCPVAGQAFTGFTSGGVPLTGNPGLTVNTRPTFDPGPGMGYQNNTYAMYASQMSNGLQVAGFNVTHAQADLLSRLGSNLINVPTGPSWGWDPTVVIPGLPTPVNGL